MIFDLKNSAGNDQLSESLENKRTKRAKLRKESPQERRGDGLPSLQNNVSRRKINANKLRFFLTDPKKILLSARVDFLDRNSLFCFYIWKVGSGQNGSG